jgi:hypothetical protein
MIRRQLRVYRTAEEHPRPAPPAIVPMRLGDLLPLIEDAHRDKFVWLDDFLDDEIRVTQDLYQILQAFREVRPSA